MLNLREMAEHSPEKLVTLQKNYEKYSTYTSKQLYSKMPKTFAFLFWSFSNILAVIMFLASGSFLVMLGISALGAFSGLIYGLVKLIKVKSRTKKIRLTERSEGYSQNLLTELYDVLDKHPTEKFTLFTIAEVYLFNGNCDMALQSLSRINLMEDFSSYTGFENYYSTLMKAYLLRGDMQSAAKAYTDGIYYMRTYMNSPLSGCGISTALAMYEYYCGNFQVSIGLLDKARQLLATNMRAEDRLSYENQTVIINYWKAMNLAAMNKKAEAWEYLNACKTLYTTDYYRSCVKKLIDDMATSNNVVCE